LASVSMSLVGLRPGNLQPVKFTTVFWALAMLYCVFNTKDQQNFIAKKQYFIVYNTVWPKIILCRVKKLGFYFILFYYEKFLLFVP
jgi:hypothetical protein